MPDIAYDHYSFIIDGKRTFLRSGAMHYFRLPSQTLWWDRLFKLKAAGYNAVDLYFCWGYHSPQQGVYDFSGLRDVQALLKMTQALGLWVIARPGPYINAEYTGGGLPGWLLAKRDLPLRHRREGAFVWSDEYMGYVEEWWAQITPFIRQAPNVILMQIENEYATLEVEPDYMQALYKLSRDLGVKVPLFHNDLYVAGLYEDIVDIYSFDNYSVTQFENDWRETPEVFQVLDHVEENLRPFCQNRPLMAAELQAGWFGSWKGYKYDTITELLGREHIAISTKTLLGQGLTAFNHYKTIGGTNWDYAGSIETYTSYDFGAPISEAGLNTERLFESKALNYFLQSFNPVVTDRVTDYPLTLSDPKWLYACRFNPEHPETHWLFFRNLTYESQNIQLTPTENPEKGEAFSLTLYPFEVQMLPYQLPLACGYKLGFSTVEPLYQNPSLLVLKADRPVQFTLSNVEADATYNAIWPVENGDIQVRFDTTQTKQSLTCNCPPLPAAEYRQIQIGHLQVILLGQHLIDRFWVTPEGNLILGAEMRLPDGKVAYCDHSHPIFVLSTEGETLERHFPQPETKPFMPPLLTHWTVENEAPELAHISDLDFGFQPVSPKGADFDSNGFYEGCAWYRFPLGSGSRPAHLDINARHIWGVFLNGKLIETGHQLVLIYGMPHPDPVRVEIPESLWRTDGPNELLIFVDGLGHPKGFHDDAQTPEGLLSLAIEGETGIKDVTQEVQILPQTFSRRNQKEGAPLTLDSNWQESPLVRLKTEFTLPQSENHTAAWGVKLQDLEVERINIYLNNVLIGRYWHHCKRQDFFYLPQGILNESGPNTLELVLIHFRPFIQKHRLEIQPQHVAIQPYAVFQTTDLSSVLASQESVLS